MEHWRGPFDVGRELALADLGFAEVVEGAEAERSCLRHRRLRVVCIWLWGRSPWRHILNSPLESLPTRVLQGHFSGQILRLKEVEKPEDGGSGFGGFLLMARREEQATNHAIT